MVKEETFLISSRFVGSELVALNICGLLNYFQSTG